MPHRQPRPSRWRERISIRAVAGKIDSLMAAAIAEGAAPGGAVAIGRRGRLVHLAAYGQVDAAADAEAVTDSTLYDLASLTKVLATTAAAMVLVDQGRLDLNARVHELLPEWPADGDRGRITVRNLLRHDAGLPAFAPLWRQARGRDAFLQGIVALPLARAPGDGVLYSDLGLILMGFIVERLSGLTLDAFVQQHVYGPLGLRETGFNPLSWPVAGSGARGGRERIGGPDRAHGDRHRVPDASRAGRVHDENAYALGGVAGHAGLFSSARDLAVLADMLIAGGEHAGVRIVREATVREFTRRQRDDSSRALGWDTPSEGSSAGDLFSAASFGHTGFTGTSLWIDPEHDVFVVLLTNRVNPSRDNQRHVQLRRDLADLVQRAVNGPGRTAARTEPGQVRGAAMSASQERLPVIVVEDYDDIARLIARRIEALIRTRHAAGEPAVLGLATGSTPVGIYRELIRLHREEGLDFSNVVTFNLDEYHPMPPDSIHSYRRFMWENFFDHVNIPEANIHIPRGDLPLEEVEAYCREYEPLIERAGGIDLQILGIGSTGHIGFNEPGSRARLAGPGSCTWTRSRARTRRRTSSGRRTCRARPSRWAWAPSSKRTRSR